MAERGRTYWRWTSLRGHSFRGAPQSLDESIGTLAYNIALAGGTLGRRRLALSSISLTGGPSSVIHYLAAYRPSTATHRLFAFSHLTTLAVHSWDGTTWTAHALSDAADVPSCPCALTFNNKLFIAYNSGVNRLHVYDGTSIRRVGIGSAPAISGTGNTGAGTYPATARFYRVQYLTKVGSDIVAMSELSAAASFTPSGTGTAARVSVVAGGYESATHWRLYGVLGTLGDTYDLYEQVGADTPIATLFIDDSTNPANYTGTQPPAQGTNIPWPSVKYLATDGNRLLGAGVWEATAGAGETTPKKSRVYFSRVLGASDLGDDESIPDTVDMRGWIDVGFDDGDEIRGLSQPVDGIVFVFKSHHIYALKPTGIDTLPYAAELVSAQIGLAPAFEESHRTILVVAGVVYFQGWSGTYRFSPTGGLEHIGWDITDENNFGPATVGACWADAFQQLMLIRDTSAFTGLSYGPMHFDVFNPEFSRQSADGARGGWVLWGTAGMDTPKTLLPFESSGASFLRSFPLANAFRYVYVGGSHGGAAALQVFNQDDQTDAGGATFQPTIQSHAHQMGLNFSVYEPLLELSTQAAAATVPSIGYDGDYQRLGLTAFAPSLVVPSATHTAVRVGGLEMADIYALRVGLSWHPNQTGQVIALTIPIHPQEPR
jgi:hypothetical protein